MLFLSKMTIDIELKGEYKQRNVSQDISSSGLKKKVTSYFKQVKQKSTDGKEGGLQFQVHHIYG